MNITKDDLLHKPQSGMIDLAQQKQADRDLIKRQTEEYLAKDGKITQVDAGVSNEVNPLTKKLYNYSLKPNDERGMK